MNGTKYSYGTIKDLRKLMALWHSEYRVFLRSDNLRIWGNAYCYLDIRTP